MNVEDISSWNIIAESVPEDLISSLLVHLGHTLKLASSLQLEDQVLNYMLLELNPNASIFVLDTGRLHQDTYDLMERYKMRYEVFFPNTISVQKMVQDGGPNLSYDSVEARKRCCRIRKIEPLGRALNDAKTWITGLCRDQSVECINIPFVELDSVHDALKVNPIADWTEDEVWQYIRLHQVPYSKLYDHGFASIGCSPCTRAIKPVEDSRAGRRWWESGGAKECGLHPTEAI